LDVFFSQLFFIGRRVENSRTILWTDIGTLSVGLGEIMRFEKQFQ
jgi:hypothetical protein